MTAGGSEPLCFTPVLRLRVNASNRRLIKLGTIATWGLLGSVDGFDQDEAESKRDERAVFCAVFSHRSAIRWKRLSLPTACSMRARAL
jgi:hypothetical protein